jgi:uncharacterized membrane protein (DUF485 family)
MQRSAELTKGHRWMMFGIALLILVVIYAFAFAFDGGMVLGLAFGQSWGVPVGVSVISGLTSIVVILVPTATYLELKQAHFGSSSEELAEIFD